MIHVRQCSTHFVAHGSSRRSLVSPWRSLAPWRSGLAATSPHKRPTRCLFDRGTVQSRGQSPWGAHNTGCCRYRKSASQRLTCGQNGRVCQRTQGLDVARIHVIVRGAPTACVWQSLRWLRRIVAGSNQSTCRQQPKIRRDDSRETCKGTTQKRTRRRRQRPHRPRGTPQRLLAAALDRTTISEPHHIQRARAIAPPR